MGTPFIVPRRNTEHLWCSIVIFPSSSYRRRPAAMHPTSQHPVLRSSPLTASNVSSSPIGRLLHLTRSATPCLPVLSSLLHTNDPARSASHRDPSSRTTTPIHHRSRLPGSQSHNPSATRTQRQHDRPTQIRPLQPLTASMAHQTLEPFTATRRPQQPSRRQHRPFCSTIVFHSESGQPPISAQTHSSSIRFQSASSLLQRSDRPYPTISPCDASSYPTVSPCDASSNPPPVVHGRKRKENKLESFNIMADNCIAYACGGIVYFS
ncbi:hypothetical protein ACLOJK_030626 [Asimina triloba]